MGLETVVNIADLVKTNPTGSDPKSAGDDHLRNIKTALLNDFAGFTGAVLVSGVDGGAADVYTLTPVNALVAYTSKMLIEFTPTATNLTTTPTLNISGLGTRLIKTVNNATPLAGDLVIGTPTILIYDGTNVRLIGPTKNYVDQLVLSGVLPAQSLGFMRSDGSAAGFTQTHTGYAQNEVKGADIAAAATINLTTATGNAVHITGSGASIATITIPVGALRSVVSDGVNTLVYSASLDVPGKVNIITAAGDRWDVRGDTAGAIVTNYTRANGTALVGGQYLKVSDQKASGTDAGSSVANTITQTRTFNTVDVNTITGASLSANQVTLPAGTYRVRGRAPGVQTGGHKAFLYNVTDATYTDIGSNAATAATGGSFSDSVISGQFTIATSKTFSMRHITAFAVATLGLGGAVSSGQVEVYAELEFELRS